jgi:hypothetical protein
MGVINGSAISAEVTNPAFLDANADDTALGKITLANTDPVSGAQIDNIQAEHNAVSSYTGMPVNGSISILPSWATSEFGSSADNLLTRSDKLSAAFDSTTGHAHSARRAMGLRLSDHRLPASRFADTLIKGSHILRSPELVRRRLR